MATTIIHIRPIITGIIPHVVQIATIALAIPRTIAIIGLIACDFEGSAIWLGSEEIALITVEYDASIFFMLILSFYRWTIKLGKILKVKGDP